MKGPPVHSIRAAVVVLVAVVVTLSQAGEELAGSRSLTFGESQFSERKTFLSPAADTRDPTLASPERIPLTPANGIRE